MGAPKFDNLFTKKKSLGQCSQKESGQKIHDKRTIEQLQQKIAEMLKDPKNAKKAAQLIKDLIEKV